LTWSRKRLLTSKSSIAPTCDATFWRHCHEDVAGFVCHMDGYRVNQALE
jgi:hypothetical protein